MAILTMGGHGEPFFHAEDKGLFRFWVFQMLNFLWAPFCSIEVLEGFEVINVFGY